MATEQYIVGRKVYRRPHALCFADNPGTEQISGVITPDGAEFTNFIILSDGNRSSLKMGIERIESRKRAINARMRTYWTADKLKLSVDWTLLPSRGWPAGSQLDPTTGINLATYSNKFTVDGGAGGNELLEWYRGHKGSFWVYLAYDRYPNFVNKTNPYGRLGQYNEVVEMFFSDFSYDVQKRGADNMDMWDVSLELEEA